MFTALEEHLDKDPTLYLDEMKDFFYDKYRVVVSLSTIQRTLKSNNMTRKKIYNKASQTIERLKIEFIDSLRYLVKCPEMALFIDETHKDRNAHRRMFGWSKRGVKINHYSPFNTEFNYTMIGAADCFGFVDYMCEVIDHTVHEKEESKPVDAERFLRYMKDHVIPYLGNFLNGEKHSVIIMDNCSIHMDPEIARLIHEAGAVIVYSAPYACDLIPIESMFHSYKAFLRRHSASFLTDFWHTHEMALHSLTPTEGLNTFRMTTLNELVDNHPLMRNNSFDVSTFFSVLLPAVIAMDEDS